MDEILCLEKLEGADVKYHSKVVFRVPAQKHPNITNLVQILKSFFARNITFWQFEGGVAKHVNSFFLVLA